MSTFKHKVMDFKWIFKKKKQFSTKIAYNFFIIPIY